MCNSVLRVGGANVQNILRVGGANVQNITFSTARK